MSEQTKLEPGIVERLVYLNRPALLPSLQRGLADAISEITRLRAERPKAAYDALKLENEDLKAFIRGIGINCQRAAETLSQVASSALHPSVAEGRPDEKNNSVDAAASPIDHNKQE